MRRQNQLFILKMAGFVRNAQKGGDVDMRTKEEIKKALKELKENRKRDHHLLSARIALVLLKHRSPQWYLD